jgi:linoleate 10R-lipoxygenase
VVEQLAIINENGRFSPPSNVAGLDTASYERLVAKRDNDLFHTSRLVTIGLYIKMVFNDCIRTILDLQRMDASWNLNPGAGIQETLGQHNIDGTNDNQTSAEFNLIYRRHSTISVKSERWLSDHIAKICPDTKIENLDLDDMRSGIRRYAGLPPADPGRRRFGDLRSNSKG